jgi:GNAT superfamily N-acetyltransferase
MLGLVTLRVYERRLDEPGPASVVPPGVEVRVADQPLASGDVGGRWHAGAEERLRDGQACAIAHHGTEVVAYCWLSWTPVRVGEIDRAVVPGPGDAYIYDAFTMPGWRGRGLFSAVIASLLALARARHRTRALILVSAGNRASRRAIERAGFELVHTVSRVGLGGLTRLWYRGPRTARVTLVRAPRSRPGASS